MGPELSKAIIELSLKMRLVKAMQEDQASLANLSERDLMILELIGDKGKMTVSEIAAVDSNVSYSTISTNITRLWRDKKMVSKTINPENQRITTVELTEQGKKAVEVYQQQRTERFQMLFEALQVNEDEKKVLANIVTRATKYFDKLLGLKKQTND